MFCGVGVHLSQVVTLASRKWMNHRPPEGRVILVDRPSWTTPQSMDRDMGQMADCSISEATDSFGIHLFGCTRSRPVFVF